MNTEIFIGSKEIKTPYNLVPLKEILKEKILYDNICNIHHSNYNKYCSTCRKDICHKCEMELHENHHFINYENLLPDLNELNIINETIKDYEKSYNSFINIINNWRKDFDNMINEYEIKMNNIIQFMSYFNNEKINFNTIYKYRIIYGNLLNYSENNKIEKNNKILEMMEKIYKSKEKEKIKKDYQWIINNNKFKDLTMFIYGDTFLNKIKKILDVLNTCAKSKKKFEKKLAKITINNIPNNNYERINTDVTPGFNNIQIKHNSSSDKNNNTSASSLGNNNKNIISFERKNSSNNSHKNGVINLEYTFNNKDFTSNHSKSMNNINHNNKIKNLKFCVYEKKKIRQKSTDYLNDTKKINLTLNNDNIKMNVYTLQNSINDTKIYLFPKCKKKNENNNKNIISSKTQNIINKTFMHDYKGFDINDKDSGPELLNTTSSIIQGVKYVSHSLRNNSLGSMTNRYGHYNGIPKKCINLKSHSIDNKCNINNSINNNSINNTYNILYNKNNSNLSLFRLSRNNIKNINKSTNNNTLINFYKIKKNNSVEVVNNKKTINNNNNHTSLNNTGNSINNYNNKVNQVYINKKKDNSLYVHKRFITLDVSKTLSSIESITSSIISSASTNKKNNLNVDTNNIFLNEINNNTNIYNYNKYLVKNKTFNNNKIKGNKIYIGLELGNTECKIGLLKQKDVNSEPMHFNNNIINNKNYITIPTIISFISNNNSNSKNIYDIKIGEDAEKCQILNASQTIFNIIKLFGKNTNEIIGKKDMWPFYIYNDTKTNKPYIKIKYGNNKDNKKNNYSYYNFEDILTIYLKKAFEIFFNKLLDYDNKENIENNYNTSFNKNIDIINIDINISVPNYFNYLQRKLIKKIFFNNLFPKKDNKNRNNKVKSNIYGKYNIQLNEIKIENVSNLASFCLIDKNSNNNNQKFSKNYLFLYIEGCSVNISIINLTQNNNNHFIEIKAINGGEFGEQDFLDNFIYDCLSEFKDKIRNNCLNSAIAMAKLRKSLNNVKISFDNEEINQTEVNINKLFGTLDLKMTVSQNIYQKSCSGLFRKIIYLIKDTILKSNIDTKDINDIVLIGGITRNIKLKNMISELFKDNNKIIYNKLINKNIDNNTDINNYIIKGAIMQCFNNSMIIPKYKLINIINNSFGIESLNGLMDIVIEKGSNIPIKYNKYIKVKRPGINDNSMVSINIYEGDNKYVKNNKLICNNLIDIKNFKCEKKDENSIEILFQFFIDSNYNLNVYILDKNTFKRQFECLINVNKDYIN